jgi:hypothetical protein
VQAQHFAGRYGAVNGVIQITQAQWQNGSNVPVLAAKLECVQVSAAGQALTQFQTVLTGPAQPGQVIAFPTFSIGAEVRGVAKVNCGITAVQTQN